MVRLSAFLPLNTGCLVSFCTIAEAIPKDLNGGSSIAWKVSDRDNVTGEWDYRGRYC